MSLVHTVQEIDSIRLATVASFEASGRYAGTPKAWLSGPLETFSLCMASHGLCVSSTLMLDDKSYAFQQISCAQALGDDTLLELAIALARQLKLQ
ncbi:MAG: hypothetical protein RL211_2193 [Pseudomonadota bacterium]|jgi:hypothetical protein